LSRAVAYDKETLAQVPVSVVNDGDYQRYPGTYSNIQLAPQAELTCIRTITGTITGGNWTVSFDPNGGRLIGPSNINVIGSGATLPFLPQNPERTGYTFTSWNTARNGAGTYFDASTPVNNNVTVYAQWTPVPVTPTPPPVINNTYNTYPSYPTYPTYTTINNPPAEAPIINVTTEPQEVTPIPAPTTPTTQAPQTNWALLDLLFTIASALLVLVYLVKFLVERKRENDEEYEEEDWRAETKQKSFNVTIPAIVIAAAGFIEALIILLATQDFAASMILVDSYTVLFSVIVFVVLIIPIISAMRQNQKELALYQQIQYQQQLLQQQQSQQSFQKSASHQGATL
jgi:uncharacterized repeat protein (TIGR02543 family)